MKVHVARKHPGMVGMDDDEEGCKKEEEKIVYSYSLDEERLLTIVKNCVEKVSENECYDYDEVRKPIKDFQLNKETFNSELILQCKVALKHLLKANIEKFYCNFFGDVVMKNKVIFPTLPESASTLLLTKLADNIIVDCKKLNLVDFTVEDDKLIIDESELCGLNYIAGYILHKLYKKSKYGKKETIVERDHMCAILLSCKGEGNTQRTVLIDALNRGGLWYSRKDIEQILVNVEQKFRNHRVKNPRMKNAVEIICRDSINDNEIQSFYGNILEDVDFPIDNQCKKYCLYAIIELYLKVRVHSYAKFKMEEIKSKLDEQKSEKKGLRKALKAKESLKND